MEKWIKIDIIIMYCMNLIAYFKKINSKTKCLMGDTQISLAMDRIIFNLYNAIQIIIPHNIKNYTITNNKNCNYHKN